MGAVTNLLVVTYPTHCPTLFVGRFWPIKASLVVICM